MKYERADKFDADLRSLKREHRLLFSQCFPAFSQACDAYVKQGRAYVWPSAFRVKQMQGRDGVWEMTWSFSSPAGRATFEFVRDEDETVLRWRRIGYHDIFGNP